MNKKIFLISVVISFFLLPLLFWGCGKVATETTTSSVSSTTVTSTSTTTDLSTSTTSAGSTTSTTSGGSTTSTTSGGSTTSTTSGGSTTTSTTSVTTTTAVAPTVLSTDPTAEATGVPLNASIFAYFSGTMDASTITNLTFKLSSLFGNVIGNVTYDASSLPSVAELDPFIPLTAFTTYTATLTAAVKNIAGTPLASPYTWSFTTGAGSDTTPPTVEAVSPEAESTAEVDTVISVRFSKVMNLSTINSDSVYLSDGSTPLAASVVYVAAIKTAFIIPSTSLNYGYSYYGTVSSEVKDTSNNPMVAPYTWHFMTQQQVARPSFLPHSGSYECNSLTITMECSTPSAQIRYTIDGTTPSNESTLYSGPFVIESSKMIKAIAVKDGMANSLVRSNAYDLYWWQALDTGCNQMVWSIEIDNSDNVYAAGQFTSVGGITTRGIAKWNGSVWAPIGSGITSLSGKGYRLLFDSTKTNLYLGGDFTAVSGVPAKYVAKWDGATWEAIGSTMNDTVFALAQDTNTNSLYVGGYFTLPYPYLLEYSLTAETWGTVEALNNPVYSLLYDPSYSVLFVGGTFTGSGMYGNIDYIAERDGSNWCSLSTTPLSAGVISIAKFPSSAAIVCGGSFTNAGGFPSADLIAKWDWSIWKALGGGVTLSNEAGGGVYALKFADDGVLYIGGSFVTAEGLANAAGIVRWDSGSTSWSAMGEGLNDQVRAINVDSLGNIYVGGNFTDAGGIANADYIAKWGKKY